MSVSDRIRKKMKLPEKPILPVVTGTEVPVVTVKEPAAKVSKPPAVRKCCGTNKGQSVPHLPDCPGNKPMRKERHCNSPVPYGWRWPIGTVIEKRWDGTLWNVTVYASGNKELKFCGFHKNSMVAEGNATRIYLKSLEPCIDVDGGND